MINWLLFVLFFVICYLLAEHIRVNQQVKQFQKRNILQESSKENSFKKLFSKINLIKTKENELFLQGNPLKLNAITYYVIKITLTLLFIFAGFLNYHSYIATLLLGLIRFFLP